MTQASENEIAEQIAKLGARARTEVKGLSARVVCKLYGKDKGYMIGGAAGDAWNGEVEEFPKCSTDWESFVFVQGGGSLFGRMTGRVHFQGSRGFLDEDKSMMFIHQLMPEVLANQAARCALPVPALSARSALLLKERIRASAGLYFQSYLRSVYRAVAGADEELLLKMLGEMPGEIEPSELLEALRKNEEEIKAQKKSVVPQYEDGRIKLYYKDGKKKVLVNAWIWGEESGAPEAGPAPSTAEESHYDELIANAAFPVRAKALIEEAARYLGPESAELITLVADQKGGRVAKVVEMVEKFGEQAEANMFDPSHIEAAKSMIEQLERYQKAASRYHRLAEGAGVETEKFKSAHQAIIKLKRKLSIL